MGIRIGVFYICLFQNGSNSERVMVNLAEKAWKSYVKVGFDGRAFLIGWIRRGVEYKFYRTSSPSFECNYWWRDCISVGQPVSPNLDI